MQRIRNDILWFCSTFWLRELRSIVTPLWTENLITLGLIKDVTINMRMLSFA